MKNGRNFRGLALLCAALLGATAVTAAGAAEAGLMRHGAVAEARARISGGPIEHNASPADGRMRPIDGTSAHAGIMARVSDGVLAASAEAVVRAELGAVNMSLLTTQARTPMGRWAESDVLAAGLFQFETTVLGAPGSSGRLRIGGSFAVAVAPDTGPGPSSALIDLGAAAETFAPGQVSCRAMACRDDASFTLSLENGETLLAPTLKPFMLELDVRAGDQLRLSFLAGARMNGGYVALIGRRPLTLPGSLLVAADADADAEDAMANGFGSLLLDGGLSLAPVDGLMQLPDGSYGFAAPVPEPATAVLLGSGLLGLLLLRRRR